MIECELRHTLLSTIKNDKLIRCIDQLSLLCCNVLCHLSIYFTVFTYQSTAIVPGLWNINRKIEGSEFRGAEPKLNSNIALVKVEEPLCRLKRTRQHAHIDHDSWPIFKFCGTDFAVCQHLKNAN